MVKWKFRSCFRCDGDVFIDNDLYGWFEQCIQCGYNRGLSNTVELGQQPTWSEEETERRVTTQVKVGGWR